MALSLACNILSRQGSSEPLLPAALLLLDGSEDDLRHCARKENRVCRRGDMRFEGVFVDLLLKIEIYDY